MAAPSVAEQMNKATVEEGKKPAGSISLEIDVESRQRSKLLLLIALVLGVAWWISLATLAAISANPPTLNYTQFSVEKAEVAVIGTIKDRSKGTFDVKESYFEDLSAGEITITNLKKSSASGEGEFLIPLRRTPSGAWEVVPTPLPKNNLIAYPVTEKTREQFKAITEWRTQSLLPPP